MMLLMAAMVFFSLPQVAQTNEAGTVVGVIPAFQQRSSSSQPDPVTIAILPFKYSEMWKRATQQRLDSYWEMYKPQFAVNKELFLEFNRTAERDSLKEVMAAMRRELGGHAADFIKQVSAESKFEFRNLAFGTYRLVAIATSDFSNQVWTTSAEVRDNVPIFISFSKPLT